MNKETLLIIKAGKDVIYDQIASRRIRIQTPFLGDSFFLRAIREFWFRCHLPFQSIWYNKQFLGGLYESIVLFDPQITFDYVIWLKRRFPNSNVVLWFGNPVLRKSRLCLRLKNVIRVASWDKNDCTRYGLSYVSDFYFKELRIKKKAPVYDVVFIGRDKGRSALIKQCASDFRELGLKSMIYIVRNRRYQLGIGYNKPIPYREIQAYLCETRSILEILQKGQSGSTLRLYESVFNEIKLLTNDNKIKESDLYNPQNIFIIGEQPIESVIDFLGTSFIPIEEDRLRYYDFDEWLERIVRV